MAGHRRVGPTILAYTVPAGDITAAWRDDAACTGLARLMDSTDPAVQHWAIEVCWACPVLGACRAWLARLPDGDDPGGVAGAWTEAERTADRRKAMYQDRARRGGAALAAKRRADAAAGGLVPVGPCGGAAG
jgi:hypothetical protein